MNKKKMTLSFTHVVVGVACTSCNNGWVEKRTTHGKYGGPVHKYKAHCPECKGTLVARKSLPVEDFLKEMREHGLV
jgi:hypothetical protein